MVEPAVMFDAADAHADEQAGCALGTVIVVGGRRAAKATVSTTSGVRVTMPPPERTRVNAPVPLLTIGVLKVVVPVENEFR